MPENPEKLANPAPRNEKDQKQRSLYLKTFSLAVEFGFIIALPLLVFAYLGKWLDAKYHNKLFLLGAILLALTSSITWLYRRVKEILKDLRNK